MSKYINNLVTFSGDISIYFDISIDFSLCICVTNLPGAVTEACNFNKNFIVN